MSRLWLILAVLAATLFLWTPASADVVYNLNIDSCTGGCGTAPYGTVTLHAVNADDIKVTVSLTPTSSKFINSGNATNHEAFTFNTLPGVTITFADPTKFQLGPTNVVNNTSWGKFAYSINCQCANGGGNGVSGPLIFDVYLSSGLTIANFVANTKGYLFAADIISGSTGNTGVVGTRVPEPVTLSLFGTGFAGAVALRRRRKRSA